MGKTVLTDQIILVDDYDITGDANAIAVDYDAELKDSTTFQHDTRVNMGGLKTVEVSVSGLYSADTQDAELFSNMGVAGKPISFTDEASGVSYFFNAIGGTYEIGTEVGEIMPFSLNAGATGNLVRGQVAHNARETAETSTDAGTGAQLGAVASGQKLYALLHVVESDGSGDQTLDLIIESDDNAGFTSGVTRLTFTQVTTGTTSELLELDGALTDDYYRASWTIAGTGSPSFKFVVLFGVL